MSISSDLSVSCWLEGTLLGILKDEPGGRDFYSEFRGQGSQCVIAVVVKTYDLFGAGIGQALYQF